ncbi:MAG: hypothetical protein MJ225_04880 [Bacilli bacterium]|nr:hypothetical protein [Bacilli bacterium]
MNTTLKNNYIKALTKNKIFTRLSQVTTMLPPPNTYTNRKNHTFDVVDTAKELQNSIISKYKIKGVYNLEESCYAHDIGHCCFAHETEVIVNDFISKELHVLPNEAGFSHSINGALVFAIAANPNKKKSDLSKLNLFNNSKNDMKMIIDSTIKHSFKKECLGSIYFEFVDEQFKKIANFSLFKRKKKDDKPLYKTGYYVRVADDIASKNSDFLDLQKLYYRNPLYLRNANKRYILRNYYIKELDKAFLPYNKEPNIEEIYEDLALTKAQKSFLKVSYGFDYKKAYTMNCQLVVKEVLDYVALNPWVLKKTWNQRFKYIKDIYADEYFKVFKKKVKLQKTDLDNVRTNFLLNPNDPTNQYRSIYYKYICAVAFEISNFTDVAFKDFAKSIQNNLSPNAIISLAKI